MLRSSIAALCFAALCATPALSAEPILGKWRSPGGRIVEVTDCGGAYCATVITGKHKGKSVGRMSGTGGDYRGTVTDPRDEKSYNGTARVEGARLIMEGCALKIFCKKQSWTRA